MNTQKKYRRKKTSYTLHFREDCKRFPVNDYVEEELKGNMMSSMICHLCKKIEAEEKAKK